MIQESMSIQVKLSQSNLISLTFRFTLSGFSTDIDCSSIPLSFLRPTTHVFHNRSWPGSRKPFLRNYSIEGPTTHWWARRRLGSRDIVYSLLDIS